MTNINYNNNNSRLYHGIMVLNFCYISRVCHAYKNNNNWLKKTEITLKYCGMTF